MSGVFRTQAEADTRLLFHPSHSFHHGYSKVMVYAKDTDVEVIAVAVSNIFENWKVWIAFGHGNKLRYIPCHLIAMNWEQMHLAGFSFSTLCQYVILFKHSVGLERKQPGLFGAVCLT